MTTPTRLRDIKVSARDQLMLNPRDIAIEPNHNPRNYHLPENRAHLDELKASIREKGTLIPLLVRWDVAAKQAVLVDGECRLRANLELIEEGIEIVSVPTIQVSGNNEADRLITSLTANTGKPLSKWEVGTAFKRLIGFGWETKRIAEQLGYSERYVNESLELSDAPEEIKNLLSQQAVTPSLALVHIRKDGTFAGQALNEAVNRAKAKAPTKVKVTAKRERKQIGMKLSPVEIKKVVKALKLGAKVEDVISLLSEACREALEIFDAKKSE